MTVNFTTLILVFFYEYNRCARDVWAVIMYGCVRWCGYYNGYLVDVHVLFILKSRLCGRGVSCGIEYSYVCGVYGVYYSDVLL